MHGTSFIPVIAALALIPAPAVADIPDPDTGKIAGYTYGSEAYNSYTAWSGGMPWIWQFSAQHIGVSPTPVAGQTFYLHVHTAMISPHSVTGDVLLVLDQDAGGLPLRYAPTAAMPLVCSRGQFDPILATSAATCPASVSVASGQFVVSNLEPLVPGFGFDVLVPVAVDQAAVGTAAMTAMWATSISVNTPNVLATVPVTVGAAAQPVTKPIPKKLRKYKKVKSLTPAVCKVQGRTVVKVADGICRLKGTKRPGHGPKVVSLPM